jgi:hypothetical protein
MILSTNANLWAIAGMVYALAGSALLCNAVFLSPTPGQSGAVDGSQERRRQCEQWLDTRIGAVLIVIGFFLQATGALGTETLRTPAVFVLLGLCLAAAYYAMMKGLLVENLMAADERPRKDKPLALVRPVAPQPPPPVVLPRAADTDDAQGVMG